MPVIETDGITRRFGDVQAVVDLDLAVDEGQLFGFIGPNGAGKTTTISILTGQLDPDRGTASVMKRDPVDDPVGVRERVGILPEREDPPSFLTPQEYFSFVGDVRGIDGLEERVEAWADRLGLQDRLDTLNKDLSKGERQKVMITQAFLHEPDLVFIDEPLINLDPIVQETVKEFFRAYQEEGNTIFLSTHVMGMAEEVCTHVGIIDNGHLIASGPVGDIVGDGEGLVDAFIREVEAYEAAEGDA